MTVLSALMLLHLLRAGVLRGQPRDRRVQVSEASIVCRNSMCICGLISACVKASDI